VKPLGRYGSKEHDRFPSAALASYVFLVPNIFLPNDLDMSDSNNSFPYPEVQKETDIVCSNVFVAVAVTSPIENLVLTGYSTLKMGCQQ
jgi:hypothetical protein